MNVIVDYNERRNQVLVIESGDTLTLFDAKSISGETAVEITDWVDWIGVIVRTANTDILWHCGLIVGSVPGLQPTKMLPLNSMVANMPMS